MATFSKQIKEELALKEYNLCCQKEILKAFVKINGNLIINNKSLSLEIKTKSTKIATMIYNCFKNIYQIKPNFKIMKVMKLNKDNTYIININQNVKEIINDLSLYQTNMFENNQNIESKSKKSIESLSCCISAYLTGCFLATGNINNPSSSNYHLEIACKDENQAEYIIYLLKYYNINAKTTKRRQEIIVYLKSAEKIADFLRIVKTNKALLYYEEIRIERDFINSLNRLENCEIANDVKVLEAANKQIKAIECLIKRHGFNHYPSKTQIIMQLRLDNKEKNLNELANLYFLKTGNTISKSGIYSQLNKLIKEASLL